MKHIKILLIVNEQNCMPNHGKINIQIYKKLVNMGSGEDIFFEQFLLDFKKMKKHIFWIMIHNTKTNLFFR
jgi:hypothetical protein